MTLMTSCLRKGNSKAYELYKEQDTTGQNDALATFLFEDFVSLRYSTMQTNALPEPAIKKIFFSKFIVQ